MAMYNSIFTGGEIDKGVGRSYVPTLQSAPTTSTLTFTLDGNTIDFEIGQMARVADQNEATGYKFYQLHDITESSNVKTAHWQVMTIPDAVVVVSGTTVTQQLAPKNFYSFGEVSALTITLGSPVSGENNEYKFEFDSGSTATNLSIPASVIGIDTTKIAANKHYEISIKYDASNLNYYGLIQEW